MRHPACGILGAIALVTIVAPAFAASVTKDYPTRTIRFVVPYAAGGRFP